MPHDPYRALYLHIPFCASRCGYCDFATRAVDADTVEVAEYMEGLILALRRAAKQGDLACVETVYIGGGTPTHVGAKHLTQLLYALGLSMHLTDEVECTVEANPESLDERLVRDLWALGANRLSIGVQSFDDELLGVLGRAHTAEKAREAIRMARTRFENVSCDLMCGLPGQTLEGFEADVREAAAAGVTHMSIYPLTIEEHTPFFRAVKVGSLEEPDEDAQATMMEAAARILIAAGFHRYEVANYALPGFESRHNTAYWTGKPYLGLGASAATMTQNATRRMRVQDGEVTDDLDERQMAAEDLMLAMRMARGASEEQVAAARELGLSVDEALAELEEQGAVVHRDGRYQPTERGWLCGNVLYGRLLDLAP